MRTNKLFRQGGPYQTRRIGPDQYEMSIPIPADEDGFIGRECTLENCSPRYFKVKSGTGITENHTIAYCPYCGTSAEPAAFATDAQTAYALGLVENEAIQNIHKALGESLGLGPAGKKRIDAGLVSLEISIDPLRRESIFPPVEERLRRDIICPHCDLEHAVYGLAVWCPDCGADVFLRHVSAEFQTIESTLKAIEAQRTELGERIVTKAVENALEDVVSVFEAVLKAITRRYMKDRGIGDEEILRQFNKSIRNRFQNVVTAADAFKEHIGVDLYTDVAEADVSSLARTFEKRHVITHNLGVIDRKYLDRTSASQVEGQEIGITTVEIEKAMSLAQEILHQVYPRVFPVSDDAAAPS